MTVTITILKSTNPQPHQQCCGFVDFTLDAVSSLLRLNKDNQEKDDTEQKVGNDDDDDSIRILPNKGSKDVSEKLINDEEYLLGEITQWHASILEEASDDIKADRQFILKAVQKSAFALEHAPDKLKADKEVVLAAVQQNGYVLVQDSSETLRSDKEVVVAAVKQEPTALKFALGGLNQDPGCLKAAGLFDDNYDTLRLRNAPRIVLLTKFSLGEKTTSYATKVALLMKKNPYFASYEEKSILCFKSSYSPNAWDKNTCDLKWTDITFPCRGTKETCKKYEFKDNLPVEKECCWRSSYRYQLMRGKETGGFMVQVAEFDKDSQKPVLGDGQQIEIELAEQVGLKVFRVYQQLTGIANESDRFGDNSEYFISELIDELVKCAERCYKRGCSDMSVAEVRIEDEI